MILTSRSGNRPTRLDRRRHRLTEATRWHTPEPSGDPHHQTTPQSGCHRTRRLAARREGEAPSVGRTPEGSTSRRAIPVAQLLRRPHQASGLRRQHEPDGRAFRRPGLHEASTHLPWMGLNPLSLPVGRPWRENSAPGPNISVFSNGARPRFPPAATCINWWTCREQPGVTRRDASS